MMSKAQKLQSGRAISVLLAFSTCLVGHRRKGALGVDPRTQCVDLQIPVQGIIDRQWKRLDRCDGHCPNIAHICAESWL